MAGVINWHDMTMTELQDNLKVGAEALAYRKDWMRQARLGNKLSAVIALRELIGPDLHLKEAKAIVESYMEGWANA